MSEDDQNGWKYILQECDQTYIVDEKQWINSFVTTLTLTQLIFKTISQLIIVSHT